MENERLQVLEMVAAGRVTPQQGAELLSALVGEQSRPPTVSERATPASERRGRLRRFSVDELVRLHDHGVEPSFLRQVDALGLGTLSIDQLIHMADHGIEPSFLREVYDLGLGALGIEEIAKLADHGVGARFLRELRDLGLSDLPFDRIVELADHGVDGEYLRALAGEADHRG
jgi:hypothetical protein